MEYHCYLHSDMDNITDLIKLWQIQIHLQLVIPMIILALLLLYSTDATNLDHTMQQRLFSRFIDDTNSDSNARNENLFDEIKHESNPKLRHLEDLVKTRQR